MKMRTAFLSTLTATLAVLATYSSASFATPVIDQQNWNGIFGWGDVGNGISRAQSFVVGQSGLLTEIDISVSRKPEANTTPGDNLIFDLYDVTDGIQTIGLPASNNNWLARVNIGPDSIIAIPDVLIGSTYVFFGSLAIDLKPFDLMVAAGDQLAFVLWSPTSVSRGYETNVTLRGYDNGGEYMLAPDFQIVTWLSEAANFDIVFRSFVDPEVSNSIPEPGSLGLLGLALGGLAISRRKPVAVN